MDDVPGRVEKLAEARATAARQLDHALDTWARMPLDPTVRDRQTVHGRPFLIHRMPDAAPADLLRRRGNALRALRPDAIHLLVRGADVGCSLTAPADATGPTAGAVLSAVLGALGGKGGGMREWAQGRLPPTLATATTPPASVDAALARALETAPTL